MESYKVVILGDSGVGKTTIIKRFVEGSFQSKSVMTMGASFLEKEIFIPGTENAVKMQVWDTAGQERFKTLNRIYYRDCAAAIVVYDITKRNSLFTEALHYIKELKDLAPPGTIIGLAGNKSDLYAK